MDVVTVSAGTSICGTRGGVAGPGGTLGRRGDPAASKGLVRRDRPLPREGRGLHPLSAGRTASRRSRSRGGRSWRDAGPAVATSHRLLLGVWSPASQRGATRRVGWRDGARAAGGAARWVGRGRGTRAGNIVLAAPGQCAGVRGMLQGVGDPPAALVEVAVPCGGATGGTRSQHGLWVVAVPAGAGTMSSVTERLATSLRFTCRVMIEFGGRVQRQHGANLSTVFLIWEQGGRAH